MIQVLTRDTVQILRPTDSYGIKESYTAVKLIHTFAKDPEGTQVADYIAMVTKCIWIARAMTGRQHLPEDLDKFYNSITDGKLETTQDFIESLSRDEGDALAGNFLFYLEKEKKLSGWRDKEKWKVLLPKFTADANLHRENLQK
jgi:hypothetical protein